MTRFVTGIAILYNNPHERSIMTVLSLPEGVVDELARRLDAPASRSALARPVEVLYGGAHLFKAGAADKLGGRARAAMATWGDDDATFGQLVGAPDPRVAAEVARRVREKLARHPIEAIVIDFEDGFGPRPDEEEDREALRTAEVLATDAPSSLVAPVVGIRIKALTGPTVRRGLRTLDLFLTRLVRLRATPSALPLGFTVTLPKVTGPQPVAALVEILGRLEAQLGVPSDQRIGIELMIESPRAFFDERGALALPALVAAGGGRVVALHLGAYDLTAEVGVTAGDQRLDHPLCDLARALLQIGSPVPVSDGATTLLPIPDPGAPALEQRASVHRAWAAHARNVTRAIDVGIWQGWDLHPAQLPARYGALFAHFATRRSDLAARLRSFVEKATQASRVGQVFDDAATGHGLIGFFRRGLACGALDEEDLVPTGLDRAELDAGSFDAIAARRR